MITLLVAVIFLTGFSVLAFWSRWPPAFMLAAGVALMVGLKVYDAYPNDTTLSISLCLIGYAFGLAGFAFRYIFWKQEEG